ncbi:hypothetical protein V6B08_14595 [Ferrovibrio sp. MS7]
MATHIRASFEKLDANAARQQMRCGSKADRAGANDDHGKVVAEIGVVDRIHDMVFRYSPKGE